jgi:hypothetical protein
VGVFDGPFPWEHTLGFYLAGMESVKFRGQTGVACSDERSDTMFYLPAPGGTNGVSPLVWRRLLVSSKTNLTDLHEILRLAFGWSGFYLYAFRIHGRTFGDARSACLADFQLHPGERFRYRYNFFRILGMRSTPGSDSSAPRGVGPSALPGWQTPGTDEDDSGAWGY